ncbi:MAG: hypothetical protein KDC35_11015 [Acidobacteria bacterium]|nr:hypothetical protein [Acidobacteriota bacterium]
MWLCLFVLCQEVPSAETLLQRSIEYHDPRGLFTTRPVELTFHDEMTDGSQRRAHANIDVKAQSFRMTRQTDVEIGVVVNPDACYMTLNGTQQVTQEMRDRYRLSCERAMMVRNYITYLWGLPMKLRDPGTILEAPFLDDFEGQQVYAMRVTYAPDVGGDIWYFYFRTSNCALVGYRFYHDETKGDGEVIVLSGEVLGDGLRLPAERAWYTHQGNEWLGTDRLKSIKVSSH